MTGTDRWFIFAAIAAFSPALALAIGIAIFVLANERSAS